MGAIRLKSFLIDQLVTSMCNTDYVYPENKDNQSCIKAVK